MTSTGGTALLDDFGPLGGRQRYRRPTRLQQGICSLPPIAPTEDLSSRAPGRGSGRLAGESPSVPFGWLEATLVPAHGHPSSLAYGRARRRQQTAAEPARSASDLPRCSLSLSSMWLAVFKMMHRSGGRQGCGQLLTALAALTDRARSRQNFSSALWAPWTLRLSPGAASFQHQPTREETT
jgi:hypothetical protein